MLYGAISTGQIWQFGTFDRATKHLTEDLTLYRVPEDLILVGRILMHILAEDRKMGFVSL